MLNLSSEKTSSRNVFTLVELLVILAVVLASPCILLPALKSGSEDGMTAACKDNLKKQGAAFAQYAQDFQDSYPIRYAVNRQGKKSAALGNTCVLLNPYLGIKEPAKEMYFNPYMKPEKMHPSRPFNGSKVFYCPAWKNTMNAARYSDYGARHRDWRPNVEAIRFSKVKEASTALLRLDTGNGGKKKNYGTVDFAGMHQIGFRHGGRANVLYFDGHAGDIARKMIGNLSNYMRVEVK